jgi:hypothetical protein
LSDRERDKQALEEMDRALGENMAKAGAGIDQAVVANPQPTPHEQFKQLVTDLQSTARQQQLKTEQSIQQTLQQAATALADAQKIDLVAGQLQTMQQALAQQQGQSGNLQYFQQMLQQLTTSVHEQLHQSTQQAAQSLQQTVSSMAQSQAAMFDSQSYMKISEMLKQCDKTLQLWQNPPQQTVH